MLVPSVLVLGGLLLLVFGGDRLVGGASGIALLARVPATVVGLTVVAAGTSMPELVVSIRAAFAGAPDVSMGNVVGSNIFNIAAVIGISAIIAPLAVHGRMVRLEWPVMFLAALSLHLLARDLEVDRFEGGFLALSLVIFTGYVVRLARRESLPDERQEFTDAVEERSSRAWGLAVGETVLGIVVLSLGAELLVRGAVDLARLAEVPDRVIGLTVVAAGTSLPELFASGMAAWRGRDDVAVANVLGSNIFNAFGILGLTAIVHPLQIDPRIPAFDNWWMLGLSLLLFPILWTGLRVTRLEGLILVGIFGVYIALLF